LNLVVLIGQDCGQFPLKEGEIEIQEGIVENRGTAVCLYLQSAARGKGQWHHGALDDGEFPIDRTIHDPDRFRFKGQMEAALIPSDRPSEACDVGGAGSMGESMA
jgi:hypothetical protein